jgi:16S rRNA (cytosine967-C5)-methyltransferase
VKEGRTAITTASLSRKEGAARAAALDALERVDRGQAVADALEAVDAGLAPADRRLATQLVYGVLRRRRLLDWWIERRRRGALTMPIRHILRLALYQAVFLDRVPRYAAVSAAVEQARRREPRAVGLVNAILRRALDDLAWPDDPAIRYSFPDWLVDRWRARWPDRWEQVLQKADEPPPLTVRVRGGADVDRLRRDLADRGVGTRRSPWFPDALRIDGSLWLEDWAPFREGAVYVQDEGAMAVAYVVDPPPAARILDLAAGLGGKTFHLLDRAPGSFAVAVDVHGGRLERLRETARRLGVTGRVETVEGDARVVAARYGPVFDVVVLDAPCTGLGVVRRRPDIRYRRRPADLARMAELQKSLVAAAWQAVRPGGVMVYSVCSVEPEETTAVARWWTATAPDAAVEDAAPHVPPALRQGTGRPFLMIVPGTDDADGFFIARWRKGSGG